MKWPIVILACFSSTACVSIPDVYLIDRHTIMESEASGEWPQLEERFRKQALSKGPVNMAIDPSSKRKERAFQVLNGEFPAQAATQTKSSQTQPAQRQ